MMMMITITSIIIISILLCIQVELTWFMYVYNLWSADENRMDNKTIA